MGKWLSRWASVLAALLLFAAFSSDALAAKISYGWIQGTVKNASGAPIVGANVSTGPVTCASDSTGSYALRVVVGTQIVTASAQGYITASKSTYVYSGKTPAILNFVLTATPPTTGTLSGVVTDAATGAPVANSYILVTNSTTQEQFAAASNTFGAYLLNLPPGSYDLTCRFPWYIEHAQSGIAIAAGLTTMVGIALQPEPYGGIQGYVIDALTGVGIPGAEVTGCNASDISEITDSTGYFLAPDLHLSTYDLTATAPGYAPRSILNIPVTANTTTNVDFFLYPAQ